MVEVVVLEPGDAREADAPVGAGLLHKLMEEMLTQELNGDLAVPAARAFSLLAEQVLDPNGRTYVAPDPQEKATTAWRTLQLPEIAVLRHRLIPEWPVYGLLATRTEPTALAGRIDAGAFADDAVGRVGVEPGGKCIARFQISDSMWIHACARPESLRCTQSRA